jgi:hypothetical protein
MRKSLSLFLAVAVATALLAQPALATTPTDGGGTFTFHPVIQSVRTADGNTFLTATANDAFTGSFTGPFTEPFVFVTHPNGTATVQGTLTCTCIVDGRAGTLTLRFEGTQAGPTAPVDGQFVVQDATGGLAGLRGVGTFHDVGPTGTYAVRYHFDP